MGSGTTLVEAKLLGRNAVGVDVNPNAIAMTKENLSFECDLASTVYVKQGNAMEMRFIKDNKIDFFICTHPPYADIIRYSDSVSCVEHKLFQIVVKGPATDRNLV